MIALLTAIEGLWGCLRSRDISVDVYGARACALRLCEFIDEGDRKKGGTGASRDRHGGPGGQPRPPGRPSDQPSQALEQPRCAVPERAMCRGARPGGGCRRARGG